MDNSDLDIRFSTHKPTESQAERMGEVRNATKDLVSLINGNVRDGREKSLAMTALEEALFWANAGIVREGR